MFEIKPTSPYCHAPASSDSSSNTIQPWDKPTSQTGFYNTGNTGNGLPLLKETFTTGSIKKPTSSEKKTTSIIKDKNYENSEWIIFSFS